MSTLPEDPSIGPGYWIFKWPFKISQCLKNAVLWHDAATSKGSSQANAEIPGSMVDETFKHQIENCATTTIGPFGDKIREVVTVSIWKKVIDAFGRWFTEGKYFKGD